MRALHWPGAVVLSLALAGTLCAQRTITTQPSSKGSDPDGTPVEIGGKTLHQWMSQLKSGDPSVRAEAIVNIVQFGDGARAAVPQIVERCRDHEVSPRCKAVLALKYLAVEEKDVPRVVEALAQRLLEDGQAIVRYEAAVALARYTDKAKPAIVALLHGMEDPICWEIRQTCISDLRLAAADPKVGPDPRVTRALIKAMYDRVEKVRMEATITLGAMGRPHDPNVLAAVVRALQDNIKSKDKILALWSNVSLMALDDKVTDKSVQAIVKLLDSPEREHRVQALYALRAIGPKAKSAVSQVLEALEDKEKQVVSAACLALAGMNVHTSRVNEALIKATQRKEKQIIFNACSALVELGDPTPDVVAALRAVTERKELDDELIQEVRRIQKNLYKDNKQEERR
jgi:HEAT repeat protein